MGDKFIQVRKPLYAESRAAVPERMREAAPPPRAVPVFAGFWVRFLALALDVMLIVVLHNVLAAAGAREVFFAFGPWCPLIGLGAFLVLFVAVPALVWPGQTPGKRLMRLRVVTPDFQNPALGAYLKRFAVLFALFLVQWPQGGPLALREWLLSVQTALNLAYIAALCLTLTQIFLFAMHPLKRGLHDLWADTYVVRLDSPDPRPAAALAAVDDATRLRIRRAQRMALLMLPALILVLGAQVVLRRGTELETRREALAQRLRAIAGREVSFGARQLPLLTGAGAATASPEAAPSARDRAWQIIVVMPFAGEIPWDQVQGSQRHRETAVELLDAVEGAFDPAVFTQTPSTPERPIPELPLGASLAAVFQDYLLVPGLPMVAPVFSGGSRFAAWHRQYLPLDLQAPGLPGEALIPFPATPEMVATVSPAAAAASSAATASPE